MRELRVGEWVLNVKEEKTEHHNAENCKKHGCLLSENFRQASCLVDEDVLGFSNMLGLDLHNPTTLQALPVAGNQVMYSGYYTICGEIIAGEIDAWDMIVGQHCFSLVEEDDLGTRLAEPYFQIGFEVVLQWLLPESIELVGK
ncbi:hypothetical protein [Lysinibacillus piscis]|uniref:Uncharacterized protein n=1 Tax=Lysinibacillus piscis TaxID=2518931 RepID=A0ABQ5NP33_9BACI|nr:hypothetical protein [Lysinibacillus sp. KH24]GLC89856.1 hypothetical protein LYSBPC_29830 [Lysinibacillus sp. KH24]